MRDIMKKLATGSMIAGAALFVAACGGNTANTSTTNTDMGNDSMYDMNATDTGMDANMTTDANAAMTDTNAAMPADANAAMTDTNGAAATNGQ
jgi:hypothetical protein